MVLTLQNLSVHQSILLTGLQQVIPYLQWPILLYHDGQDNVDFILKNLSGSYPMFLTTVAASTNRADLTKPQSTVFIARSPAILNNHFRKWSLWNAHGRILVILEDDTNVQNWITQLWVKTRAVDVVVMVHKPHPTFFTWFPYQKNECINVVTISKLTPPNLFPPKIVPPLHNCPLTATTSSLPPFVTDDDNGMEPRMFHVLAEKLSLKARYTNLPAGEYVWRLLDDAGEPVGGLKQLLENDVDLLFTAFGPRYATDFTDFLPTHFTEHIVWFVPAPPLASKTTSIYRAFTVQMWALVFSSFLSVFSVLFITGSRVFLPVFLNTLAINLSLPTTFLKTQRYLVFTAFAYLYSLHITTAYESSLLIFLSDIPREKPISTIKDLETADLKIMIHSQRKAFALQLAKTNTYRDILRPDKVTYHNYLYLDRVVDPGSRALLGPYCAFGFLLASNSSYYYDMKGFPKVLMLQQAVASSDVSFLMPKGHPLVPLFSKYILRLLAAGLPNQFIREQIKNPAPQFKRKIEPFGMDEIEGPFYLFLVLMSLAFFAWIVELIVYNFRWKRLRLLWIYRVPFLKMYYR